MPKVKANGITLNYGQQGHGEALILIPYLSADNTCYAFQVAEYAKYFTCISVDLRGTGETDKPDGEYTTELYADDVAALMDAVGIARAHVSGLSLGGSIGMWLAAKHPEKVTSLSVHGGWTKTDPYLDTVVKSWQVMAKGFGNVPDLVIEGIFPWCFTPELYATRYDLIQSLAAFVRSRPPMSVDAFMKQSNAVLAHDVEAQLARITAPTQITFGRHDQVTSVRFAEPLRSGVKNSELLIFETASHAPIYEVTEEFNQKTLAFLQRHAGRQVAGSTI
jgi:pimeloyl-ACP methyl ester carboxylesterase